MYLRLRKYVEHDTKSAKVWNQGQVCVATLCERALIDFVQVADWLKLHQLEQYVAKFAENGISGGDLLDLSHEDLQSMGITRCTDRKAVLRCDVMMIIE